jgi:hypothetical protein
MVVVGLKPSPKTWFKIARGLDEGGAWRSQTKWRGTLAWFPSIFSESNSANVGDRSKEEQGTPTAPILAFSWGHSLRVVRIEEVRIRQVLKNVKTGREKESEVGAIDYQSMLSWAAEEEILAMQWLNSQVCQVLIFLAQMDSDTLHSSWLFSLKVKWACSTCGNPSWLSN